MPAVDAGRRRALKESAEAAGASQVSSDRGANGGRIAPAAGVERRPRVFESARNDEVGVISLRVWSTKVGRVGGDKFDEAISIHPAATTAC